MIFSNDVLAILQDSNIPRVVYANLVTHEWFDSHEDDSDIEYDSRNVIMWKYIKMPDDSSVVNETGKE